jgi:hypothetical protein
MIKETNTPEEAVANGLKPNMYGIILCDTLNDMLEYKSQHKWNASFQHTNGKYVVFPDKEKTK